MIRKSTLFVLLGIVFYALGLSSCRKFSGTQTVPSYIHIDSITVDPNTDYYTYGASTSKVTDAWVYVDDQLIGTYELPATFPVLKKGPHEVIVIGGIKVDGRSDARDKYPFYQRRVYGTLNLTEDSIVTIQPVLNYLPIGEGTNMAWMEDFETTNTLLPEDGSDANLVRVAGSEAWQSSNSFFSGKVELPPDSLDFAFATADEFDFYDDFDAGVYCLLEMDYCCNDTFCVGVQYYESYQLKTLKLVKVTPTDKTHVRPQKWNKIYINIGPWMNKFNSASYFKIYFTSDLTTQEDVDYGQVYHPINERRYYYFDNLKLLYRNL